MRCIDEVAPRFRTGGLVRDLPEVNFERLWTVGIAAASNHIPVFGGVLYGAAALHQDVALVEGKATPNYQDSQVDVSDMTFVQVANRLIWKEYHFVYRLLQDLFEQTTLPDLVLLDLPLLVVRVSWPKASLMRSWTSITSASWSSSFPNGEMANWICERRGEPSGTIARRLLILVERLT